MTAHQLLLLLQDLPPELGEAYLTYSPSPGVTVFATYYHPLYLPPPLGIVTILYSQWGQIQPLTVDELMQRLLVFDTGLLDKPIYIPTVLGNQEITGITVIPLPSPYGGVTVNLNGAWGGTVPGNLRPIPFDRRKQRPAPPAWPNIPVADP